MSGYTIQLWIGPFPCWVENAPLESLDRSTNYRWPSQARLTRPNALQFVGAGDDTVTVNGYIHPHEPKCGGKATLDGLRALANAGVPYMVITGSGYVFGKFSITDIQENWKNPLDDMRPRRVDFTVTLKHYGSDQ